MKSFLLHQIKPFSHLIASQMETCRRNEFSADSPRSSTLVSKTQEAVTFRAYVSDPIHNLLVVPVGGYGGGRVLIFDRTASGNTPPKAFIKGPVRMGNQLE